MRARMLIAGFVSVLLVPVAAQGQGQGMGPGGKCVMMGAGPGPGKGHGMNYCWTRERIFGTRLMTLEERQAHMEKMWNAKTVDERNKLREEHRKLMLERAKQQQQTIDEKLDDSMSIPQR